ncbi:unnamed protein product [Urochloa decumbens]|uniref:SKP1-like protein n=1 Tax=Urochloa decumbens TaxID=240449 RepID=A0ABC9A6R9_9POAL
MASANVSKMIKLKSSDHHEFEVEEAVAMESQTIRRMIEDGCADDCISLPDIDSEVLMKVIEFCRNHVGDARLSNGTSSSSSVQELQIWEDDFVKADQAMLYDLIMAAYNLKIKGLLQLTCQAVADMIKGKTTEEIRKILKIKNDFTHAQSEIHTVIKEIDTENPFIF